MENQHTPQAVEDLNRPEARPNIPRKKQREFTPLEVLKIEYVPTSSLYPNAYNPNRQTEREFSLLLKSMEEDGFTQPIVVHKKTKQIIDGEHRWRAATRLGMEEVPVVFVDMTEEEMRIATLRHNRARGSEDVELSIKILQDLRTLGALDHAVDSLNITERELEILIDDLPAPEQMAAEEFSSAWIPTDAGEELPQRFRKNSESHISDKAMEQKKVHEQKLEKADSLINIGEINKRESGQYITVTVVLQGSDASFVKRILGNKPSERLMLLAAKFVEQREDLMQYMIDDKEYTARYVKTMEETLGYIPQYLKERL